MDLAPGDGSVLLRTLLSPKRRADKLRAPKATASFIGLLNSIRLRRIGTASGGAP